MKTNYKTIQKVLYWITICWFKNIPKSISIGSSWLNQVEKWEKSNGSVWTIAHVKMMRQLLFSYLSGNPQKEVKQIIGINRNTGLPKAFNDFSHLITSGKPQEIRFILTLLSISRLLPGMKKPDLSTITKPSNANSTFIKGLEFHMDSFLKEFNWNYEIPHWFNKDSMRFSPKSGPNGSASRTALFDLVCMPPMLRNILDGTNIKFTLKEYGDLLEPSRVKFYHLVQNLWPKFERSNAEIKKANSKETNVFKRKSLLSSTWFDQFRSQTMNGYVRKLSIVNDPEAKARIIAIFDYWSQSFLRQIHDIHFNFLKRIPTDRTFTQDPILPVPPIGHKYYSFDLSAATDRFPMALQELLVKHMFGEDLATRWRMILTSFEFVVPWESTEKEAKFVSYAAGQPMGAYSSWSTFTITHHFILFVIHKELKLDQYYYQILGDDIVIWHDAVAKLYLEYMKELDVGISIPKSNISYNMYEFAKRVFIDGIEVTGIQLGGFVNVIGKYHLVYQNLFTLIHERRYSPLGFITIPEILDQLHIVLGLKPRMRKNLFSRVKLLHAVNYFIHFQDNRLLVERLNELYPENGYSFSLPEIEFNNIIYLACDKILRKINAQYIDYAKSLMTNSRLVEQAAIGLGSPYDVFTSPLYYISKLPIMRGLINNIVLQNKARKLDSIKDLVKAIALPNDNIFEKRNGILLANCNAKLAKIFLAEFKSLRIDERPANMPELNLGGTVLSYIVSDLNRPVSRTIGLGLDPPQPKPNPYGDPYMTSGGYPNMY